MPDITLTEQEAQTLLRCLNDRVEPPEDLAKKLFPKLYAGFDFKTLNRASIPTIEYADKPIGVATYRIVKRLPRELQGQLPDPAQIHKLLSQADR